MFEQSDADKWRLQTVAFIVYLCMIERYNFDLRHRTVNFVAYETITGLSVTKRLKMYEFTLWGRDFVSVVRIIEGS